MIVYLVSYGDMECLNLMTIFSTRKLAEDYLAPYYDMVKKHGKDCIEFFYPEIIEMEVDKIDEDCKLQFYSVLIKYQAEDLWGKEVDFKISGEKGNRFTWSIRRVTYIPLDQIIASNEKFEGSRFYTAATDEEEVKAKASEFFGEKIEWLEYDVNVTDDDLELVTDDDLELIFDEDQSDA